MKFIEKIERKKTKERKERIWKLYIFKALIHWMSEIEIRKYSKFIDIIIICNQNEYISDYLSAGKGFKN
jgi:hypothetical protein